MHPEAYPVVEKILSATRLSMPELIGNTPLLNTLAAKPPKSFVVASEFLLGEYVHLLQSQLQRYGDYIAGLGGGVVEIG